MTTRLVPGSGANYAEAGDIATRQLYTRITGLTLGILSPEEIEQMAPAVIHDNTAYAKNLPKLGGPNDPSLGPSDRRVQCSTCFNTWFQCPGHHGVIRLPIAVYHVGFVEQTYKTLQMVCWCCSEALGDPKDSRLRNSKSLRGIDKFQLAFLMGRGRYKCRCCGMPQPKYALTKVGMVITRTFAASKLKVIEEAGPELLEAATRRFTPTDALDILRNISDETCRLFGMDPQKSHPSWMILQNLSVLPPNARPAIMAAEGSKRRGQDDITSQTQDIIKVNRTLRKAMIHEDMLKMASKKLASKKSKRRPQMAEEDVASDGDEDVPDVATLNRMANGEFALTVGDLDYTEAEVAALRVALPKTVVNPSAKQAAALWEKFPLLCEKLQNSVTILFDNTGKYAPQARQRTGGAKKSLTDRFIGKQGRIRGNCVAKRVDLSARTVIKPDASLDVDELGIPEAFAVILTLQEDVNLVNMKRLQKAVQLGHGVMHGASRILHASGEMTQLQLVDDSIRRTIKLQVGDTVERHLLNGDRVMFNRQPSLHRLSVMVHRIHLVEGLAIAVPLAVAEPYNADFDGDEMNLHVLQSMFATAEAVELMAVTRNIMNPQNNQPCLSLVQDVRVGAMLLTQRTSLLSLDAMHQCVGAIRYPLPGKERLPAPDRYNHRNEPLWTGKQLVSMIMPSIFVEKRVRGAGPEVGPDDPRERYVLIEDGILLHGALCKGTLGNSTGGIIHRICTLYGQEATMRFLSDFQRIIYSWLPTHGLTMGLRDCMIPISVQAHINETTARLDETVARLTEEALSLQPHMTKIEAARVEAYILTILTSNLDYASRLVMNHSDTAGGFRSMVEAGSKGNSNNIAQVMAFLGQQVVDGHRIAPSASSKRTLPMFPQGAFSAAARGFIVNSYLTGMRPHEYFNHMQGGREGLVATAVKTAETGYKYRSMAKGQETNVVQWDASVRNAQGYIIEFVAGGDCLDPTRIERVVMGVLLKGDADIFEEMDGDVTMVNKVLRLRDLLRSCLLTPLYQELSNKVLLPINIQDEIKRLAFMLRKEGSGQPITEVSSHEYFSIALELVERIAAHVPSREVILCLELAILYECRPSALRVQGISPEVFRDTLAAEIFHRFLSALIQPGDSVGIISAQSIGEPSTQFTLDAFHQAGLVQRRMTVGVPRLKELLHASERIATPSMVIPFRDSSLTRTQMDHLGSSLQFLCVDFVLHSSYVQYDPPGDGITAPLTTMYKDSDLLRHAAMMYGPETQHSDVLSPWIIRLVLNRAILTEHDLTPEDVAKEISKQLTEYHFLVVYAQPNMSHWILRIRLIGDQAERDCRIFHARVRENVLLGGIDGVRDSRVVQIQRSVVDPMTRAVRTVPQMVVDTEGSALMKVATRDWADWENTVTNDIIEVVGTLGIAAARALLFAELDRVISYDGGYVDARHLRALTNTMTHRGYVMSMTRHGINRVDFSVLQRASYEEPVDMILQAALTSEKDDLNGMCQSIMLGQKVPIGTGTVSLQQDVEIGSNARPRNALASREIEAATSGESKRPRRLRANILGRRALLQPHLETFKSTSKTEEAWRLGAAAVSRHVEAYVFLGRRVVTNIFGQADMESSGKSQTSVCATAADLHRGGPIAYRPNSPSDILDEPSSTPSSSKKPRV